jgi:replicative DNA helicase
MRKARLIGAQLIEGAAGEGTIDAAIRDLMTLALPAQKFDYNLNAAIKLAIDEIDEACEGKAPGLTTGLADLDKMLGGLHGGDLVIVGARPAMGKTALMLNMAASALMAGFPVGVFSGEQGVSQITQRLIAIQGRIPVMRMRNGSLIGEDWSKLSAAVASLKDRGMYIFDKPAPTLSDIVRRARSWHYNHGIKAIYLDYLQRVKITTKAPRHEAIGEIAAGLKELARELNIPVIALAQVNREVEKRVNKRPFMGDLKDSGTIEQEADQIFMLYRDEVYNEETKDKGLAEINIEKNRHGSTGRVDLAWRGEYLRFENLMRAVA